MAREGRSHRIGSTRLVAGGSDAQKRTRRGSRRAVQICPTESEIASVAYRLWLERGGPTASDQQDWLRAEAMLKNALVVKCEDLFRRSSIQCSDTRTESEMPADFRWEGHWEVW